MSGTTISGSVGRGGANRSSDVMTVQSLMNRHLAVPFGPLTVDGRCDDGTVAAIEEIQRQFLNVDAPDGRVDPDGKTLRFLVDGTVGSEPHSGPGVFPNPVIDAAQASHRAWRIPASVSMAQWAVESSWGRSMPPGSNNPFGIKAGLDQPFVEASTHEFEHGQQIEIVAKFRKFDSLTDAFDQHGKLLATDSHYATARTFFGSPDGFADALTGVYATDPSYGTTLKSVMRAHNLYQYD